MNKKTIMIATGNANKVKEFKEMLEGRGYEVLSLKDLDQSIEIVEDGETFASNAIKKAQSVVDALGIMVIADDSGLEIDAWDKKPGVQSARFLGHDTPYSYKNQVILERMQNEENRTCRYVCAIAICDVNQEPIVFEDCVEGSIVKEIRGENGFGYDPIFYYEPFGKTMAEMSKEEKHSISHRGKAVKKLEAYLEDKKM